MRIYCFIIALIFTTLLNYQSLVHAENLSYFNMRGIPTNESIIYKGIATKSKNGIIIHYSNTIGTNGFWTIKENRVDGSLTKNITNPFLLSESDIKIDVKTERTTLVRLNDMRIVSVTTIEHYPFGSISRDFELMKNVNIVDKENEINIFSFTSAEQLTRAYPFDTTKQMQIKMPTSSPNSKIKMRLENNGSKPLTLNKNINYTANELELKIDGLPFAIFFPKIQIYIEDDPKKRLLKFNTFGDSMETIDFYMTDYSSN